MVNLARTSLVESSRVLIGCGFFSSSTSSIMCEPPSYTTDLCRKPLSDKHRVIVTNLKARI